MSQIRRLCFELLSFFCIRVTDLGQNVAPPSLEKQHLIFLTLFLLSFTDKTPVSVQASVQLQPEHNFAMSVTGKTKGRTGIKVVLKVTDTKAGQLEG